MRFKSYRKLFACAVVLIAVCSTVRADAFGKTANQVTGTVFLDQNASEKGGGERGLEGVAVSDGFSVMLTDAQGKFTITWADSAKPHFVFVVTPAGYQAFGDFYKRLPTDSVEFHLIPCPRSKDSSVSFAQISDIHIQNEAQTFIDDLREIAATKPAFIVATGDLTNTAKASQFDLYRKATESIGVPVINVIGNHDCKDFVSTPENYETFLGPTYYSFDWGPCHFVVINSMFNRPQQMDWLRKDIALLGNGKYVIVMQHYPPDGNTMRVLTQCKVNAILTGHWHSNKVIVCDGIIYINAPPLRFGGIDLSPRGFKTVTVVNHKLSVIDHYSACRKHLAIVIPANGAAIAGRKLNIRADAYDTVSRVVRAQFSLDGSIWTKMNKSGSWGWEAGVATLKPGPHRVKVKVVLESGEALTKTASFTASGAKPAAVKPGHDWPMFKYGPDRTSATSDVVKAPLVLAWSRCLGGTISVSSPVTAHGLVYVGVADNELSGKSGVYALDARTGAIKWVFKTETPIKHTVAVDGKNVYAAELGGTVDALDAETGAMKWHYSLGSSTDRWVYSSPLVKEGVVYVGVAPVFVALDAKTGAKLWQAESMGSDWISSLASPATGDSSVYVGFNGAKVAFALDSGSGKKRWNRKSQWVHSTPAYSGAFCIHVTYLLISRFVH